MKSLTTKPGTFKAVCRIKVAVPLFEVPEDLLPLVDADVTTPGRIKSRWERKLSCNVVDLPCPFGETEDRAAFDQHMREAHNGGLYRWDNGSVDPTIREVKNYSPRMAIPVKPWSTLKGTAAGKPFKTKAEGIETCGSCGLVAEVGDRAADVMWWDEHERLCVGSVQDVA